MVANGKGNRSRTGSDELLVSALAVGKTRDEAALAANVSPTTVSRRLANPEFKQRIQRIRGELIAAALGKVSDSMSAAADTLRSLLTAESESIRLGAARAILDAAVKLREAANIEERLASLEEDASKARKEEAKAMEGGKPWAAT